MERDDYRQAEIFLNEAEHLEPDALAIRSFRLMFDASKPKHTYDAKKLSKPLKPVKQKKKKR
jgi:hypothetical protein